MNMDIHCKHPPQPDAKKDSDEDLEAPVLLIMSNVYGCMAQTQESLYSTAAFHIQDRQWTIASLAHLPHIVSALRGICDNLHTVDMWMMWHPSLAIFQDRSSRASYRPATFWHMFLRPTMCITHLLSRIVEDVAEHSATLGVSACHVEFRRTASNLFVLAAHLHTMPKMCMLALMELEFCFALGRTEEDFSQLTARLTVTPVAANFKASFGARSFMPLDEKYNALRKDIVRMTGKGFHDGVIYEALNVHAHPGVVEELRKTRDRATRLAQSIEEHIIFLRKHIPELNIYPRTWTWTRQEEVDHWSRVEFISVYLWRGADMGEELRRNGVSL